LYLIGGFDAGPAATSGSAPLVLPLV